MAQSKGPRGFTEWYQAQEGDRWPTLEAACRVDRSPVALEGSLLQPYFLDEASILAGRWLDPGPDMEIVDLCAAPGGKTLVVLEGAIRNGFAHSLTYHANERSQPRRDRLRRVLSEHLPPDLAARINIWGHDAARWGQFRPDSCDRVLLDAPCSSERHVLVSPNHLADWSPGRSVRLAQQSYAMLLSAIQALKPNGMVLYVTCAISALENDQVVNRALERCQDKAASLGYRVIIDQPIDVPPWAETTCSGIRVLPDRADGRGPLYIARLRKVDP